MYGLRKTCSSSNLSSIELERADADGIACLGRRRACVDSKTTDAAVMRWDAMGCVTARYGAVRYEARGGTHSEDPSWTSPGITGCLLLHGIATTSFVNGVCSCKIASEMLGQRAFQRLASLLRLTR